MSQLTLFGLVPDAPIPTKTKAPKPKHYSPPVAPVAAAPERPAPQALTPGTASALHAAILDHPERVQILEVITGTLPLARAGYGVPQFFKRRAALLRALREGDDAAWKAAARTVMHHSLPRLFACFVNPSASSLTEEQGAYLLAWFTFEDRCFAADTIEAPEDDYLLHYTR